MQSGDSTFQHHLNFGMCLLSNVIDDAHMDEPCLAFTQQVMMCGPQSMPEQTHLDKTNETGGELDLFYMYFY